MYKRQCLVTGEAAHHIALLAKDKGVGLVVAGHWGTEQGIADVLARRLCQAFPQLEVRHAAADTDPHFMMATRYRSSVIFMNPSAWFAVVTVL